jgi:hypothetical protein
MVTTTATELHTCPEWCAIHDHEADVCLAGTIALDFTTGPDYLNWRIPEAYVSLSRSPEEGTDVLVGFFGSSAAQMCADDAEKLALAVLAMVATARRGGTAGAR